MGVREEFLIWHQRIRPDLEHVELLLRTPLNDQPEALIKDLVEVETWGARIHTLLAEANSYLDKATFDLRPPKEGKTAYDIKVEVDATVVSFRLVRDKIEALAKAVHSRLVLGGGILSYQRVIGEHRVMGKPELRPY